MDLKTLTQTIDNVIRGVGNALSWLGLVLVLIVCTSVFLRYVWGVSNLGFDELQWHIYSLCWLAGLSYATVEGTHVRNDILYNRFSRIWRLRIDFWGHLLLVVPFVAVALYHAWDFVSWAWKQNEGSIDPGGLPARWIIKSALLWGLGLFAAAAISRSIALAVDIRNLKKARP